MHCSAWINVFGAVSHSFVFSLRFGYLLQTMEQKAVSPKSNDTKVQIAPEPRVVKAPKYNILFSFDPALVREVFLLFSRPSPLSCLSLLKPRRRSLVP